MKNLKFIFLTFLLSFIIFCTRPPRESLTGTYDPETLFWLPDTYDFEKVKSLNYPFDEVWLALIDILKENDMHITSLDKASGIIIIQEWTTTDTLVESRYCDCGHHTVKIRTSRGFERRPQKQVAYPRTAHTVFYVTSRGLVHTEVETVNDFYLSYRTARGLYLVWEKWKCTSTGKLESQLFQMIETKLSSQKSVSPKDH